MSKNQKATPTEEVTNTKDVAPKKSKVTEYWKRPWGSKQGIKIGKVEAKDKKDFLKACESNGVVPDLSLWFTRTRPKKMTVIWEAKLESEKNK